MDCGGGTVRENVMRRSVGTLVALTFMNVAHAQLPDAEVTFVTSVVDARAERVSKTAMRIWDLGEVGFQESRSSALLQEELRDAGFEIETGVAGMPTAFVARYGAEPGPVIALLAEFDALAGLSQARTTQRKVVPGQEAGHACGHNLLGTGAVAAAIAVKQWMIRSKAKGEIRLYGTPAEEGGGGKVFMVRDGLFKDVDATLHWHPMNVNVAWQTTMNALMVERFRFTGRSAHAASAPHEGRSALAAVEAMNHMTNAMRQFVPAGTLMHYSITDPGPAAANVVPERAEVTYIVRHSNAQVVEQVMERVRNAAKGAALGTDTAASFERVSGAHGLLPNDVMGKLTQQYLERVGGIGWTGEELKLARALAETLPEPGSGTGFEGLILPYSSGEHLASSTDVGDVSWMTPTGGIATATWPAGIAPHTWQAVAASGSSLGVKGAILAAKVLALTAVDLFSQPQSIDAAKAELQRRRGEGFVYRSLIGEMKPDLDYARGGKRVSFD